MNESISAKVLESLSLPMDSPQFYPAIFTAVTRMRKLAQTQEGSGLRRICAEEYDSLSQRLDNTRIQDSCAARNILRTRRLANLLINDKGELNEKLLPRMITLLSKYYYSLGPDRQHDSFRHQQILRVLNNLINNKPLLLLLKRIGRPPHSNPNAEQLIRETLNLSPNVNITDAHARRAVLSAWMSYLRQSVGSCFATAPAIIVHDEQAEMLLTDLGDLLSMGLLKRTYGGIEYSVPLSISWGVGDLRKPVLLTIDPAQEKSHIWHSPGLIAALEGVEVLDKKTSTKDKIEQIRIWVKELFTKWNEKNPYLLINTEEVLKKILMRSVSITQEDLEAYDARPKAMIHASLLMQAPTTGMGGKGELCALFHSKYDRAASIFKSFVDNALLKGWEYTVASFSEIKANFTRWNLYSSLGLNPQDRGGIGQCLMNIIQSNLDRLNLKAREIRDEYEMVFSQVKYLESRLRHGDKDNAWAQAEYQSKVNEFHTIEQLYQSTHGRAELFAKLYDILIEAYDRLFPQYFQEVYDPELHEVKTGPYDDSPAGFRLLYKHGRGNVAQWTKISTPSEFIEALSQFFISTEREILHLEELEGLEQELGEIITEIVNHVRTHEFLESAFHRMAAAHNMPLIANPLEHLDKLPAKPWAYVSGGTMSTLVSCYYRREQTPTEVARWVENPIELLVFFVETLRSIPYSQTEIFIKKPDKSLLMHSPTHAFLLKPGWSPLKEAWQAESYTYTWVRDNLVRPVEEFVNQLFLDGAMMDLLIERFSNMIPGNFAPYFRQVFSRMQGQIHPCDFREYLIDRMSHERGLQWSGNNVLSDDEIDSVIYTSVPFFPSYKLRERLEQIWELLNLPQGILKQLSEALDAASTLYTASVMSAQTLQDICMGLLCLVFQKTSLPIDYAQAVVAAMQQLQFAMPRPIFFADTNWAKDLFAFVFSPGTRILQLWRVDPLGRIGYPMSQWKEWLNGLRKDRTWGIYSRVAEYTPAAAFEAGTIFPGKLIR